MWYEDNRAINYNKPIFAKTSKGIVYLLMPCIDKDNNIIGYNWFNIQKGHYNSTVFYSTVEIAINMYEKYGYKIYNGTLSSIRD